MGIFSELFSVAQSAPPAPYTIKEGPEWNKWDEALGHYGTIRMPPEMMGGQGSLTDYLNQKHIQEILRDVDRRDLPDGSVILSRKAFTS